MFDKLLKKNPYQKETAQWYIWEAGKLNQWSSIIIALAAIITAVGIFARCFSHV